VRLTPVCEISLGERSIQADIVRRKGKRENTLVENLLQDGRLRRLFGDMAGVVVAVVVTKAWLRWHNASVVHAAVLMPGLAVNLLSCCQAPLPAGTSMQSRALTQKPNTKHDNVRPWLLLEVVMCW
jgi:hypothetical protein